MDQKYETINNAVLTNKDRPEIENYAYPLDGRAHIEFSPANLTQNEYSYSLFRKPTKARTNNSLRSFLEIGEGGNFKGQTIGLMENFLGLFNGHSAGECNKTTPHSSVNSKTKFTINEWVLIVSDRNSYYIFLYLNGTLVNNQGVSYKIIPYYRSNVKAIIGCRSDYSQQVIGDIDEILNYNKDLSSPQILNLFKFGYTEKVQTKVYNDKVWTEKVTSLLRFDLKTHNAYCNSTGIWKIYGSDNTANSFQLINQITGPITNSFNILKPNKINRNLFIAMVYDCRCIYSSISNKVFTDDQAPSYLEPNILSVNLERPKVIMISQYNIETDHMEYLFIIGNPVNGVKKFDCEKNVILYSSNNFKFKVKPNEYLFAHSRYDNYLNTTRLSDLHSPILFLIKPLHDDTCTKKIRFNSTTVVGCTAKGSQGYIRDKKNTSIYFNKVSQDTTSHKFKLLYLNVELNKLIRATKFIRCIDTKSNMPEPILSDFYRGSIPPNVHDVSIENETNINLEYSIAPEKTVLLQHGDQNLSSWGSTFAISRETNTTHFTYHLSNTPFQSIDHSLKCHNYGNNIIVMRNNTSTINLANNNKLLASNKPSKWKVQSFNIAYLIQKKSDSVSPIIRHTPSSFYDMPSFDLSIVRTISKTTSEFKNDPDWSKSEIILGDLVFDSPENNTTKVPGAFTPNENNVIHSKSNEKSKITESTIGTLHRLGEYIIKVDSLVRWDVKFTKEHLTPIIKPI